MSKELSPTFQSEEQQTAIAHAAMLREIAAGRYKPKKSDEIERRFNAVLTFLVTGQCVSDAETASLVTAINQAIRPEMKRLAA